MLHRRFQEGLQRVHGSIEGFHNMRNTRICVAGGTFEARQNIQGAKVATVMRIAMDHRHSCDCWHFSNAMQA